MCDTATGSYSNVTGTGRERERERDEERVLEESNYDWQVEWRIKIFGQLFGQVVTGTELQREDQLEQREWQVQKLHIHGDHGDHEVLQNDQDNDDDRARGKAWHGVHVHIHGGRTIPTSVHTFPRDGRHICHEVHACCTRTHREQHHLKQVKVTVKPLATKTHSVQR